MRQLHASSTRLQWLLCRACVALQVVKRLNANRVKGVPEIPVTELEQKNVRAGNVKDPYTKPGAEQCFDSVSRWYACDVEHYGFASLKQTAASVVQ